MGLFDQFFGEARRARNAPPTVSPTREAAATYGRAGYVPGIPLGGTNDTNPGSNQSTGPGVDRKSFMDQLQQAYLACPWSSACVDVIARTCTAGGLQVVPNKVNLENPTLLTPDPPPEVLELQKLLDWVNPYDDVRQLMRGVITDLLVYGDSFTEVVYLMGKPVALFTLDPSTMEVFADEHGIVHGYGQEMTTGRKVVFAPHEVIHVSVAPPGGGIYGMSATQKNLLPITVWLFTFGLLMETMKRGDPARLHIDWPLALPEAEMRRFQQQHAIRVLGGKNIGNTLETKGGASVTELHVNQIENWLGVLQQRRDEIFAGYGVPPSKVSVVESGNIGGGTGSTQDKGFRVNTCGPLEEIVLEKFSFRLLTQCYGITDWHLKFAEVDWRDDEVIETIRDIRLRNGSWILNRYRSDIGEPSVPGGDEAILVDRQNLVQWSDLDALSKANVDAIKAKGMGGVPGTGQPAQSPTTPGGVGAEDYTDPFYDPPSFRNTHPIGESLAEQWKRGYLERRRRAMEQFGE